MAKISFDAVKRAFEEGSLLKRTLVHVGALVAASAIFVSTTSLVLVGVAKSVVPERGEEKAEPGARTAKRADKTAVEKVSGRPGEKPGAGADDEE